MIKLKEYQLALIACSVFLVISIFLPIYDGTNGLHNLIFDNYTLVWYDLRTPTNFFLILNILENNSISFPQGYILGNIPIEICTVDFVKIKNRYYPVFPIFYLFMFIPILKILPRSPQIIYFKCLILMNILIHTITLFIFYFIQRKLGLKRKFSFISTAIIGVSSSFLIYSHYLFIKETLLIFFFTLILFIIIKKNKQKFIYKENLLAFLISLFLLFGIGSRTISLSLFLIFLYLLWKYEKIHSFSIYILYFILINMLTSFIYINLILGSKGIFFDSKISFEQQLFMIFPEYVSALNYNTFGYTNLSDVTATRIFSFIYGFSDKFGNALFIAVHHVFDVLFGPKGFIFNSPFLIFSIFGIFVYPKSKNKNLLLIFILIFYFFNSIANINPLGGATPRYVRHFDIPILILTFFSFYYIQNEKRLWIRLIFAFLVVLSILNVTCLAIRADWTYEHEADLVSYDLCLWPYIPVTNIMEYNLTRKVEQSKWIMGGEDNCRAQITDEGLMTDVCECRHNSWAEKNILFTGNMNLSINACTHYAGGDGVKAKIYLDNEVINEFFIPSNTCVTKTIPINTTKTTHTIKLYSTINGTCDTEMVIWKSLVLK